MPMFFKLNSPAVTSVSVDGLEHKVNADGLLQVDMLTPNLQRELKHFGARQVNPDDKLEMAEMRHAAEADEAERQMLFSQLDSVTGRKTDRRRSLGQLREQWADYQERQRRIDGASKVMAEGKPAA